MTANSSLIRRPASPPCEGVTKPGPPAVIPAKAGMTRCVWRHRVGLPQNRPLSLRPLPLEGRAGVGVLRLSRGESVRGVPSPTPTFPPKLFPLLSPLAPSCPHSRTSTARSRRTVGAGNAGGVGVVLSRWATPSVSAEKPPPLVRSRKKYRRDGETLVSFHCDYRIETKVSPSPQQAGRNAQHFRLEVPALPFGSAEHVHPPVPRRAAIIHARGRIDD
ncbi:hypothetical protein SAMN02745223_00382 [Devosia limi DSM 17137]|uniref:Uncharacterized protein n=1 Tax=Devosia limi DSM 17137 TaxID=1121477 RepID=A0A1M4THV9_9HYPH|nr:hypothetical protein SAMN02745223_00382 [Devosia limi DSM 17137]